MNQEEKNFFNLIESWDDANIDLALQMMKGNKALKQAAQERYAQVLVILKRKTVKSLKGMAQKWQKASKNVKMRLLDHLPALEGTKVRQSMDNFMKSLKALDYYKDSSFVELPKFLPQLTEITFFQAKHCALAALTEDLFKLSKISHISLLDNKISALPDFPQQDALEILVLAQNKLKDLSIDLNEKLPKLNVLYLHGNELEKIDLGAQGHEKLTMLSLSDNKLTSLPEEIGQLKQLKELHLSNNPLKKLPATIQELADLEYLSIVGTPFAEDKAAVQNLQTALPNCTIVHQQLDSMPLLN
ncbi:MAG: leucine-rich repeat domain-containing protein [Saprospiraceae bacterium]|nr:leucine-rich repeat domain-containing protein [Saprospiraceae bacterium]